MQQGSSPSKPPMRQVNERNSQASQQKEESTVFFSIGHHCTDLPVGQLGRVFLHLVLYQFKNDKSTCQSFNTS